jgi:hypothetical protein
MDVYGLWSSHHASETTAGLMTMPQYWQGKSPMQLDHRQRGRCDGHGVATPMALPAVGSCQVWLGLVPVGETLSLAELKALF